MPHDGKLACSIIGGQKRRHKRVDGIGMDGGIWANLTECNRKMQRGIHQD